MQSFQDKLGNDVFLNDYIIYPYSLGSILGLKIGKVLAIYKRDTGWSITVQSTDYDYNSNLYVSKTKGTLQYPLRIVKITDLPEEYRRLFGE